MTRFRNPGHREAAWGLLDSIRENLAYHHSGELVWRFGKKCGKPAGSLSGGGYYQVKLGRQVIGLHRAIWAYHNGRIPETEEFIDHINGDKKDNRIENLRLAPRSQNMANKVAKPRGEYAKFGVTFNKGARRFRSQIKHDGKRIHLGYFDSVDEAVSAYEAAGRTLHGEFWRANEYP